MKISHRLELALNQYDIGRWINITMRHLFKIAFVLLLGFLATRSANAYQQEDTLQTVMQSAPNVFIDCDRCDVDYIRTEINYVNYVWDRKNADIHVLITRNRTGGGGREYTLTFIGLNRFAGDSDTLRFHTDQTMTDDEERESLVETLEAGLLPYVIRTPMRDHITLDVFADIETEEVQDQWNYWVFRFGMRGDIEGEESQSGIDIFGYVNAERVTPELKLDFRTDGSFDEQTFTYTDDETGEEVTTQSLRKFWNVTGEIVPSLSQHWSVATFFRINSSTYRNLEHAYEFFPGIEYNIFPYSEVTRREFRLQYRIGYIYNNYFNETIYGQLSEGLLRNAFLGVLTFTQPWGEAQATLEASAFLNDFSKNRVELDADLEIRVFKGFSLDINARYSFINDQIHLEKGELSQEEVLLRQRELATNYEYDLRIGFSYAFGSIYNNVVNPRFEDRRFGGRR